MSLDTLSNCITLPITGGVQVVVPNSLNLISPYVLQEQQDWFEDEIKFVRKCIRPGMRAVDIGANYGVYALSIARLVGRDGRVWAYEPASRTAACLAESIRINGFENIILIEAALSNRNGTAQLGLHANSEINSLSPSSPDMSEEVALMTLDECMDKFDLRDIAFVKLDAEGEEANILDGGSRFFSEGSPLVMFEIKHGTQFELILAGKFQSWGYRTYRFIPGLQLLVPFHADERPDLYQLNLFGCKPDRAALLENEALLVTESVSGLNQTDLHMDCFEKLKEMEYGKQLSDIWHKFVSRPGSKEYLNALDLYFASKEKRFSPQIRYSLQMRSYEHLKTVCETLPSQARLSSLARVAWELGYRMIAVQTLSILINGIRSAGRVSIDEPFLAADSRYELLDPLEKLFDWFQSSIIEQLERLSHYSSYYTGAESLQRLQALCDCRFRSDEMERRLQLVKQRFNLQ